MPTNYKTIVILHGTLFNCGIFRPIIPFADENASRIILINQRDYRHSTPFNKDELKGLKSGDKDKQDGFVRDRVRELGNFLTWLIVQEDIPANRSGNVDGGGIALVGWSCGNCLILPFLALTEEVMDDNEQKDILRRYIRSVILYDPANVAMGIAVPPAVSGTTMTYDTFAPIVSSYCDHDPSLIDYLESPTMNKFTDDEQVYNALAYTPSSDPNPTSDRIPSELFSKITEPLEVFDRSMVPTVCLSPELYHNYCIRAIQGGAFPNVRVEVMVCSRTIAVVVFGVYKIQRMLLENQILKKMENRRQASFHVWRDFNHCAHWEEPEKFIRLLSGVI
ncbi:unnamed protein product [Somion occarium]